ncbi:MAG: lamin tail domain-containing protein, partial [Pyrinomonadaceae bacterium]
VEGDANRDGVRSADDDEFVELLNNSDAPLELSGIVLADATSNRFTFPANTALEAGRAVVIFGGGAALATDETIFGGALVFKASSLGLNDGGDTLNVKLPQGGGETLIAAQSYGPGMPPLPAAPANQSLTRAPDAEVGAGGGEFNAHTTATNSDGRRFSPGTRIDGTPFGSPAITRIELTPAAATVERGATQSFAARAFASVEGGEVEVSQVSFAWESSDPSRATVAPLAGATTVAATSTAGSITIRARAGGRQGIAALAINPLPPVLTRVELVPSIAAVFAGDTQHFTARAFDQYGHPFGGAAFTFTSHDTHIATVDSVAGQPGEGVAVASVTGRSTGSARITATAQIASTTVVSNDATLNVNPRPRMLTRIEVSPASASVQVGATQQFTARGFDQDNVEIPGLSFSWSASDANVAVIGQTGLATGLRAGTVSVTASVNEIAGRAALTIEPPAVPAAGQVIINEALVAFSNTSTQARADFVELYNPTAQTLDISGLRISFRPAGSGNAARSVTLPGAHGSHPTLIRPFGYFLVINGAQTFGAGIETVNGITDGFNASSANFDLNNTTGGIELELNGVKLDGLTYQGGSTAPADLFRTYGEGSLLIFTGGATNDLIRTPNAADTDHNATDFRRNGATANVTPKAPNPQIQ